MGFTEDYWKANYSEPKSMDGIVNAHHHARYLHALFTLEAIKVQSLVDLGFGLGFLFEKMIKTFLPEKAVGIEPSSFAFNQVKGKAFFKENPQIRLSDWGLRKWCEHEKKEEGRADPYDLGICTSVLQYVPDQDLEFIVPILSRRCKFLYLTVPTDKELDRQIKEFHFRDTYAIRRKKSQYKKWLSPHFTFVSNRVLESKFHFGPSQTPFTENLFRF